MLPKFVLDSYGNIIGVGIFSYLHHWRKAGLIPGALESAVVSSFCIIIDILEGTIHTDFPLNFYIRYFIYFLKRKCLRVKGSFREVNTHTPFPNMQLRIYIKMSTLPSLGFSFGLINPVLIDGYNINEAIA